MSKIIIHKKRDSIDQEWSLIDIVRKHPPLNGWKSIFEECDAEFEELDKILKEDEVNYGPFFPLKKDIFKAFELTSLYCVKVVILGQDPYPQVRNDGYPRAQGLSFSVAEYDTIPSSLKNIYKELMRSYPEIQEPKSGNLTSWAKQGILLLNTCLTVRPNDAGSHGEIWNFLIITVFREIAKLNPGCIYVLWGRPAQSYAKYISGNPTILTAAHPSGRNLNNPKIKDNFIGCDHFRKINETLKKQGKKEIDWHIN